MVLAVASRKLRRLFEHLSRRLLEHGQGNLVPRIGRFSGRLQCDPRGGENQVPLAMLEEVDARDARQPPQLARGDGQHHRVRVKAKREQDMHNGRIKNLERRPKRR